MGKGCRFSASAQEVHAPHTKKTNKRKRNPFAVFAVLLRCCAFAAFVALLRCSAFVALLRCCAFAVLLRLLCCCALAVLRDVSGLRRARVRCKTLRLPGSAVARAPPAAGRKQETVRLHGSAASRGPNALRHSESALRARAPAPANFFVARK